MNEEEAIEELKKCKDCHYHNVEDCLCEVDYQFKETVLNLIEKQKEEIEELKAIELKAKGGVIKVTLEGLLNLENEIKQRDKEVEKKDKIINLMAKELVKAHEWFYSEFDNYTKEDFIKYFEKKAEEDK